MRKKTGGIVHSSSQHANAPNSSLACIKEGIEKEKQIDAVKQKTSKKANFVGSKQSRGLVPASGPRILASTRERAAGCDRLTGPAGGRMPNGLTQE
jgi:hypothetical protein